MKTSRVPTPLLAAVQALDLTLVETLLSEKGDPNQPGPLGLTPLFFAARLKAYDIATMLIEKGAEVDFVIQGSIGNPATALSEAARVNAVKVCEMLIEAGAEIDLHNPVNGMTALMYAAKANSTEALALLLDKGACIEQKGYSFYKDRTPLCFAVLAESLETAEYLLTHGAKAKSLKVVRKDMSEKMLRWIKTFSAV